MLMITIIDVMFFCCNSGCAIMGRAHSEFAISEAGRAIFSGTHQINLRIHNLSFSSLLFLFSLLPFFLPSFLSSFLSPFLSFFLFFFLSSFLSFFLSFFYLTIFLSLTFSLGSFFVISFVLAPFFPFSHPT